MECETGAVARDRLHHDCCDALKRVALLGDDEFLHLKEGGFFEQILKHPDVELYRSSDGVFTMRIPGVGAAQMAQKR